MISLQEQATSTPDDPTPGEPIAVVPIAPRPLTTSTGRIDLVRLKSDFRKLHVQLKNERRKVRELLKWKKRYSPSKDHRENVVNMMSEYLGEVGQAVFINQVYNKNRAGRGRRHSDSVKLFAIGMHAQSPAAYRLLSDVLILPSESTLNECISGLKLEPGLNDDVFRALAKRVEKMKNREKNVVLTIDEMNLKTHVDYNPMLDKQDGFMDYGGLHPKKKEYANEALVISCHGMFSKWKQPLGYLLSNGPTQAAVMLKLLYSALEKLTDIGLIPRVMVSDQGRNNVSLVQTALKLVPSKPYFYFRNLKIIVMYDPPHLIKSVRNNLLNNNFIYKDEEVSWGYVKRLYELETLKVNAMRLTPKLGYKTHIMPSSFKRMRVKYATQVFSNTVSAAMNTYAAAGEMPVEATTTADFIKFMDNIFDVFQSTSKFDSKPYKCAVSQQSEHGSFLEEAKHVFKNLVMISPNGKTSRPPCFTGWLYAINALQELWKDVKREGDLYLCTRNFSQDTLENLFGVIRRLGGCRTNPTCAQFRDALKHCMISDVLNLRHSRGANCEIDTAKLLFDLKSISKSANFRVPSIFPSLADTSLLVSERSNQPQSFNVPGVVADAQICWSQENIVFYVCGVCLNFYKKRHQCTDCCAIIEVPKSDQSFTCLNEMFTFLKAYKNEKFTDDFGALQVPRIDFVNFFKKLNTIFLDHYDDIVADDDLVGTLRKLFFQSGGFKPDGSLTWFPFDTTSKCYSTLLLTTNYFLRMRIHYVNKAVNRLIEEKPKLKENRKYVILCNL